MTDVRIDVASPNEHGSLAELYLQWGYDGGIADSDVVYVARAEKQPIGLVRRTRDFGALMLRGMYVSPDHRGRRIGSALLTRFVADLPDTPCFCIPFAHLTGFYGAHGFAVVDYAEASAALRERLDVYRAEGHDVVLMRRPP